MLSSTSSTPAPSPVISNAVLESAWLRADARRLFMQILRHREHLRIHTGITPSTIIVRLSNGTVYELAPGASTREAVQALEADWSLERDAHIWFQTSTSAEMWENELGELTSDPRV